MDQRRQVNLQVQGSNLTNRLNVINFASLFSGTAVATPRSFGLRLKTSFQAVGINCFVLDPQASLLDTG